MKRYAAAAIPLALSAFLSSCAGPGAPPEGRLDVEVERVELLQLESFPVQLVLHVEGWLPNPCAKPEWIVAGPSDSAGRFQVDLHAVPQWNEACIQVLAPFDVNIPLGPAPAGFEIVLNGEVVVRQVEG
jgi:hypothetical protein